MDDPAWGERQFDRGGTTNSLLFPVQMKGLFGKAWSLPYRPGFAIDLQRSLALAYQMATQIRTVNVQFLQLCGLMLQISTDGFRHARFWHIGSSDANRSNQSRVQIMQNMSFIPIHEHTPAFAPMTHIFIFNADTSIFGHTLNQCF
jgi:hypothetical protein